jgi:hypothetical protein
MIQNTEDANKYYQLVNQYIDEYVDKWKIKPTNLKNYLLGNKSRLVNFLERKGLKDIGNIDRVVLDIVEDRVAIQNDGVMTFENFKFFKYALIFLCSFPCAVFKLVACLFFN